MALFLRRNQKVFTTTTTVDPKMHVGSDQKLFINNSSIEEIESRETPATVRGERDSTNCPQSWARPVEEIYHTLCVPVMNRYLLQRRQVFSSLSFSPLSTNSNSQNQKYGSYSSGTKIARSSAEFAKAMLSEWCCTALPCPVVFVV